MISMRALRKLPMPPPGVVPTVTLQRHTFNALLDVADAAEGLVESLLRTSPGHLDTPAGKTLTAVLARFRFE